MAYTKDDVSPYRYVLGERVPLTERERQEIADEWNQSEAERLTLARAQEIERKRLAAVHAIEQETLTAAMSDPTAPQPVKDYAAALEPTSR